MTPDPHKSLREHILYLLQGGGAHLSFDKAVADPACLRRAHGPARAAQPVAAPGAPAHRPVGHPGVHAATRATSRRPGRTATGPSATPRPTTALGTGAWTALPRRPGGDVQDLVTDPATDLFAPLPHGEGQTVLREACWSPTTTPTTWGNWSWSGVCWAAGPRWLRRRLAALMRRSPASPGR